MWHTDNIIHLENLLIYGKQTLIAQSEMLKCKLNGLLSVTLK